MCYLISLLNIYLIDKSILALALDCFILNYALSMDSNTLFEEFTNYGFYNQDSGGGGPSSPQGSLLNIYVIDKSTLALALDFFILSYTLSMDPNTLFEEFTNYESYNQDSGGGGPSSPQGGGEVNFTTIDPSNDDNSKQKGIANVSPPVASTGEAESLIAEQENTIYNFKENLKYLIRKLVNVDLINKILEGKKGNKIYLTTKWTPFSHSELPVDKHPQMKLLLDKEFNGVNYKWFKINDNSVFVKQINQTPVGVWFSVASSDIFNSNVANKFYRFIY